MLCDAMRLSAGPDLAVVVVTANPGRRVFGRVSTL